MYYSRALTIYRTITPYCNISSIVVNAWFSLISTLPIDNTLVLLISGGSSMTQLAFNIPTALGEHDLDDGDPGRRR